MVSFHSPEPIKKCDAGHVQCCDRVAPANDPVVKSLLGLQGVVVEGVNILVG